MMKTKQPEALRIADAIAIGRLSADDVEITGRELRRLHTENEQLRTSHSDAQHAIANLQERVQQLGQLARDVNSRRVMELEAQLAAIGAGGVEPLRKRCLHQISEPAPSASIEQEAMQMLWNNQQQEEKEHCRNVARGTELPLYAIHHPEDINKTKRRAVPEQPAAPANVDSAPLYLNLNDRAMWVLGWNACLDKAHAAQKAAAQAAHLHAQPLWRTDAEIVEQTEILARYLLSWKWGLHPESPDAQLRNSQNTKAQKAWNAACEIQDLLTATDVENAVAEVDDAARAAQGGHA